jgi:hypothetical protein
MRNIAIKVEKKEQARPIIDYLIRMGGSNISNLIGNFNIDYYYFINKEGSIICSEQVPDYCTILPFEVTQNKVAIKSDGTPNKGKKIISFLESLGGNIWPFFRGIGVYYYINKWDNITYDNYIPSGYVEIQLPGETQVERNPKRVAIKSDGTVEMGMKIISYLKCIGGNNILDHYEGTNKNSYYFINCVNRIDWRFSVPDGYTEIFLPDYLVKEKIFPRQMWVSDISEEKAKINEIKRTIVSRFTDNGFTGVVAKYPDNNTYRAWKYAVEIQEEKKPEPVTLTMDQIAEKFDIPVELLKIKK